jgi:uncharacterized repeat protein (TIGR03803 family)
MTTNGALTTLAFFSFTNGACPQAALILGIDGNFYGTTSQGGMTNYGTGFGTIFRMTTNGALGSLVEFAYTNGSLPTELVLGNDGNFYGTTTGGFASPIFKLTNNGTLTILSFLPDTNYEPPGRLTLGIDGNFYSVSAGGGNGQGLNGAGTIFKSTPNGTVTALFELNGTNGYHPAAGLTLGTDGNLYGTTSDGGQGFNPPVGQGFGTIFQITPYGMLNSLYSFSGTNGANPQAELTIGNHTTLYGTTYSGGSSNYGTVFRMSSNGTLTTMFSFSLTNGAFPDAPLTLGPDGNLYGTTSSGGITNSAFPYGMGTVFSISLPDITVQPQNEVLVAGSEATYYVTLGAYGTPPFSVQWSLNDLMIASATNTTLTITNFDVTQAGLYSVTVSNNVGQDNASRILRLANSPVVRVDGADVGGGSVGRVGSAQISMLSTFGSNAPIYFTLDGSAPDFLKNPYQGPFEVTSTTVIRAIAYDPDYLTSAQSAPITVQILPTYQLLSLTAGGGSTSFAPAPYSGTNYFVDNTVVTVTATPSNGWSFLGWLGDAAGSSSTVQVTMTRDMAAESVFGTSVISNVLGTGKIWFGSPMPVCPYGTVLPVAAVPQTGSYLIGWAGPLSGSNNPTTLVITNPSPVVTALFGPLTANQYSLTVLPRGEGTVSVTPYTNRYSSGTMVTITATAATNQTFLGWSGDAVGLQNPFSLALTQSKVITANFSSRPILSVRPPLDGMVEQGFRFSLIGELGATNRIDASFNSSSWVPIGWITNEFGTSQFMDTSAVTNPAQFYRAVLQ